eukprot:477326_1
MSARKKENSAFKFEMYNLGIWIIALLCIRHKFKGRNGLFQNPANDIWLKLTKYWTGDIRFVYALFAYIFMATPFIGVCLYYDLIYKYKILSKYRIQKPYKKYPSPELTTKARIHDLLLMLLFVPISNFFTFKKNKNFKAIPNIWIICKKLILSIYVFDIMFYLTHRMLHHPLLYKYHKQHHEFKTSISWTSAYSSWIEFFESSVPSTIIPLQLFQPHPVTTLLYHSYRMIQTTNAHSGYDLPFYACPLGLFKFLPGHYKQERFHDHHHSHNNGSYGYYFIDALFGTHTNFKQYHFCDKNFGKNDE